MVSIFFTLLLFLLLFWRVVYIRGVCASWNNSLNNYIDYLLNQAPTYRAYEVNYVGKHHLNPWKYWWRLDCWLVEHMINDQYLIKEITRYYQGISNY